MNIIDTFLNRITMYRLVLYYLMALWGIALIFGIVGILPYGPLPLIISLAVILAVCWIVNTLIAKILRAHPNTESIYITAFILALIISPIAIRPFDIAGLWFLIWASLFAMASKYILAINKKHIFNPAAIAVVLTGFIFGQYASWWVGGNLPLLAFVLIGGLLVVRKIQRFDLVIAFMAAALASILALNATFDPLTTIEKAFVHTTLLFFAFVMITEPLTTPPTRSRRIIYGVVVGLLFSPGIHIGSIYASPELALVIGNVLSYILSPKRKYNLTLVKKTKMGGGIYDFVFNTDMAPQKKISFTPGQYMEFTLGHARVDRRGNRRYFTIASSPSEREVHLGIRFYDHGSTFKEKMLAMKPGETMLAGQLAGDFTLPKDVEKKLAFIAGGIGITPFRSMIKYLSDAKERRDVVLLYSNRNANDIAYRETFDKAAQTIGLKTVYAITGNEKIHLHNETPSDYHKGRIDAETIKKMVPDFTERTFYISGTHSMTTGMEKILKGLGVPRAHIKVDFFPGLA